jgi:CRP-like cAMP-binding protein
LQGHIFISWSLFLEREALEMDKVINLGQQREQRDPLGSQPNRADCSQVRAKRGDNNDWTLERSLLFSGVLPEECIKILTTARVKELTRGEKLYLEGDAVQQVLVLTSGFAKITQLGLSGAEVILRFGVPGDVLGAVELLSTGRHCTTAQAFRSCRAFVWDARSFKAVVERFPVLHQNMVLILGRHLLELEERFREVATERVGSRVARQVVRLLETIGRPVNGAVEIVLSREELAQMTGTTLFTVSRLLSAWEGRGLVRPRREAMTVCDVPSLRAICEEI